MRLSDYESCFAAALAGDHTLLVVGPPGVGKTFVKMNTCRRLGWEYIGICTPLCDPSFILGYPFRENGTAGHIPFGPLGRALKATAPTFVDFDELPAAGESVAKAVLRLFQFREVGEKRLPDCVRLGASGNDVGHGAGVLGLIEPLKDRFRSIITVEPHIDDTCGYGLSNGWPVSLLAYLRNSPDALLDWKPQRSLQSGGATPRGWEDVAVLENQGLVDKPFGRDLVVGKVGKGRGTEYLAFRNLINELPDVDALILNPDTAPVPENPSARYLVSMALASKVNHSNFGPALRYLQRLPAMFRAFTLRDALRLEAARKADGKLGKGYRPLHTAADFVAWTCSSDGKNILGAGGNND